MPTETRSLHRKLAQVMGEAENIPKNGTAPPQMGGFKFVQVGDAARVIRKALAEKNVSMIPSAIDVISETEHETQSKKVMTTLTVRTTWTLTDGDTGETAVIQSMGAGADTGDKAAPKAQSSAMKYALLMGFLLSTGDDPEQTDMSDRQTRRDDGFVHQRSVGAYDEPPDRPELERRAEGLIGTVEVGKTRDSDFELRKSGDDEHFALGFKLKGNGGGFKVITRDELALQLLDVKDEVVGKLVTVWGRISTVEPKEGDRWRAYQVIEAERVKTEAGTLPVMPRREEADTNTSGSHQDWDGTEPVIPPQLEKYDPTVEELREQLEYARAEGKDVEAASLEREIEAKVNAPVPGQQGFDLVESARLDAEEAAKAAAG